MIVRNIKYPDTTFSQKTCKLRTTVEICFPHSKRRFKERTLKIAYYNIRIFCNIKDIVFPLRSLIFSNCDLMPNLKLKNSSVGKMSPISIIFIVLQNADIFYNKKGFLQTSFLNQEAKTEQY